MLSLPSGAGAPTLGAGTRGCGVWADGELGQPIIGHAGRDIYMRREGVVDRQACIAACSFTRELLNLG